MCNDMHVRIFWCSGLEPAESDALDEIALCQKVQYDHRQGDNGCHGHQIVPFTAILGSEGHQTQRQCIFVHILQVYQGAEKIIP